MLISTDGKVRAELKGEQIINSNLQTGELKATINNGELNSKIAVSKSTINNNNLDKLNNSTTISAVI